MRRPLTLAQTLKVLALAQDLAPLLGQGGQWSRDLVLSGYSDSQHLLGFPSRRWSTQCWQTKSDAIASELMGKPT